MLPPTLMALDSDFGVVDSLKYLNLQWNRRYYECGTWSAQLLAADFDISRMKYVYSPNRPEVGIVESVELERSPQGVFIQVGGRFMEGVLNRGFVYPHIVGEYSLWDIASMLIGGNHPPDAQTPEHDKWWRRDEFNIGYGEHSGDVKLALDWQNERIGDALAKSLETIERGYKISYRPTRKDFVFEIYQGEDKRRAVRFTDQSSHVVNFRYTIDESSYCNHAMMFYGRSPGSGLPYRYDYYKPLPSNGNQSAAAVEGERTLIMNVDDAETVEGREAEKKKWAQKAKEELLEYPVVHEVQVEVVQENVFYMQDYDLGDKVGFTCHALGKSGGARIVGVDEVVKQGQHFIRLSIGELKRSAYRNVARVSKSRLGRYVSPRVVVEEGL